MCKSMIRKYGVVLLGCILSLLCIQCSGSSASPVEIVGTWATSDEHYTGETIEIAADTIIMSSKSQGVFVYTIEKVTSEKGHLHNSTLYTITYTDQSGEKNLLNLIYIPEDGGTLLFKSEREVVWKRI